MAFTLKQKSLIHELLGLFEGGSFDWIDYSTRAGGVVTDVPTESNIDFSSTVTKVNTAITLVETQFTATTNERETLLKEILDEYSDIRLDTISVGGGGGGGASGARYSSARQIRHLRKMLWTVLGVRIRILGGAAQGQTLADGGGSRSIPIIR